MCFGHGGQFFDEFAGIFSGASNFSDFAFAIAAKVRNDLQFGVGSLEGFFTGFRDPALPDEQSAEGFDSCDMWQSGISDFGFVQIEVFECRECSEVCESGVGDGGFFKVQTGESLETGEVCESGIGDFCATQIQCVDAGSILEHCECVISDILVRQMKGHSEACVVFGEWHGLATGFLNFLDQGFVSISDFLSGSGCGQQQEAQQET